MSIPTTLHNLVHSWIQEMKKAPPSVSATTVALNSDACTKAILQLKALFRNCPTQPLIAQKIVKDQAPAFLDEFISSFDRFP